MRRTESIGVMSMLTTTVTFNGAEYKVFIIEHENLYIISIPDLAFSMQLENDLKDIEMADEIIIHLFTLLDEEISVAASNQILSVIRNK